MYACELMNHVIDNPKKYAGKKYKVTDGFARTRIKIVAEFTIDKDGGFIHDDNEVFMALRAQVEEILQDVPFMEAVNAYHKGKKIECHFNSYINAYFPEHSGKLGTYGYMMMMSADETPVTSGEILNGKWYIRDGDAE